MKYLVLKRSDIAKMLPELKRKLEILVDGINLIRAREGKKVNNYFVVNSEHELIDRIKSIAFGDGNGKPFLRPNDGWMRVFHVGIAESPSDFSKIVETESDVLRLIDGHILKIENGFFVAGPYIIEPGWMLRAEFDKLEEFKGW